LFWETDELHLFYGEANIASSFMVDVNIFPQWNMEVFSEKDYLTQDSNV
jgi:hypothetical protein